MCLVSAQEVKIFYYFIARTGYPLVQLRIWPIVAAVGVGGAAFRTIKFLHGGPLF